MNEENNENFDIMIIGGGQAGTALAQVLAKAGKRVALAERKHLGGSCVNFGCTPTKAALASARVAHLARRGADFGITIPEVKVDFAAVLGRAREIALSSRKGLQESFSSDNPKLLRGHARLEGRNTGGFEVRIDGRLVTAKEVVLNTGTRSFIPPVDGLKDLPFIDAENWLDHDDLPEHLIIIGGGNIGLEMSQFYRRMGSRVTVVEGASQVAAHEDGEVASALQSLLEGEGVDVMLNSKVKRVTAAEGGVTVTVEGEDGTGAIAASHLFVATGRKPNTDDLGLDAASVKVSDQGIIEVNERLATSVKGIWAAGDIRGGPMFTHTSWDDHRVLESQLLGDGARTTRRIVPYAVFTDPELGRAGMTESEARKAGKKVKVARYEMKKNGKATEIGETEGFIKVVVDAQTGHILGAAVLAAEGAELVHCYIDLMNAGAPYTVIRDALHIHPTLAEAIQSVLKDL